MARPEVLMFERNRSQNSVERIRVPVAVTLQNGVEQRGNVRIAAGGRLYDLINGEQQFIEFEPREGGEVLMNKQSIAQIAALAVPKADQLARARAAFDPHAILGVERGATPEALKAAYRGLARAYHPDRFAGIDLPPEMQAYANAMLARINLAYEELAAAARAA